jgi:hypothetical protein
LEATQCDLETQLAEVEAQTRHTGGGNTVIIADKVKPPKFEVSASYAVINRFDTYRLSILIDIYLSVSVIDI